MAKGERHPIERIGSVDPESGASVVQLTSSPVTSENLYFEETPFTPDSSTVVFRSARFAARKPPWDLFRADVDGDNLVQLTDRDGLTDAVLSSDGDCVFFTTRHEICRVELDDRGEQTIARFDDARMVNQITVCGGYVFAQVRESADRARIVRCSPDGDDLVTVRTGKRFGHVTGSPTGNWVSWVDVTESSAINHQSWYAMRPDGSECRRWPVPNWSHTAWAGVTDRMQGTLLPPGRAIGWVAPGEAEASVIAEGPYFWHSSTSRDAEWLVADTNWPNVGLQLVHVPSGRFRTLCLDRSSCGHPERTHPHPVMSPDGRRVLYNSDRTGISQVYLVTVPDDLRAELGSGADLDDSRRER